MVKQTGFIEHIFENCILDHLIWTMIQMTKMIQSVISISCETSDDSNSSDLNKSSAGGVGCSTDVTKIEVANETIKTEADDSICSNQSQRQIVDENQLANLFKNVAKSKRKSRKSNKVEKLQIGSNKGQSYD